MFACLKPLLILLWQVNEAAEIVYDLVDPSANLIFGAVVDKSLQQEVMIVFVQPLLLCANFGKLKFSTLTITTGFLLVPSQQARLFAICMWLLTEGRKAVCSFR